MATDLKTAWQLFDKNGTGMITIQECGYVMRSIGLTPTDKEAEELGATVANEDGTIGWDAFQHLLKNYQQEDEKSARVMLEEAFRVYDKDDNGLIPMSDLKSVFTSLGEPISYDEVEELLQLVPVDGAGKVRSQDFINMLLTKGK